MRKFTVYLAGFATIAIVAGLTASASRLTGGGRVLASPANEPAQDDRLIVHEWGTFTNFAGADGVQLEFRPSNGKELPDFVYDRARQAWSPLSKAAFPARQRMETPVTYFYTRRPRELRVKVQFPRGLLTEFYPPALTMGPPLWNQRPSLVDSFLDWGQVRIIPEASLVNRSYQTPDGETVEVALPQVEGDNHYAFARETDSAIVQAKDALGRPHFEKFLFYRGVGNFDLPVQLQALGNDRFSVTNSGRAPISDLFLIEVKDGQARLAQHARLAAGTSRTLELPSAGGPIDRLVEPMVQALTETGLYDKEARSMVKTWQSSWFGEDGTRLLYLVPGRLTDRILPLEVEPRPDEMVRVLVGRMETLTPERSEQLLTLIAQLGTCASANSAELRGQVATLGRFAEPALRFLAANHPDYGEQIELLLAEMAAGTSK